MPLGSQPDWILKVEDLAWGVQDPRCHASTICETEEGLAVAFFGGFYDGTVDHGIWLTRWNTGAWSEAEHIAGPRRSALRLWNPVLHALPDGTLLCFCKEGETMATWRGLRNACRISPRWVWTRSGSRRSTPRR